MERIYVYCITHDGEMLPIRYGSLQVICTRILYMYSRL